MHELTTYDMSVIALGAIAFGIYLLIKGGDWTVEAAVFIAEELGLSKLFIGATIVAFGTSVPELFTSVNANLHGFPGIALGNVVGSNVANTLLVIGASAMVFTLVTRRSDIRSDVVMMLVATAILVAGMLAGVFPNWAGGLMFLLLVGYVVRQYCCDELSVGDLEEEIAGMESRVRTIRRAVLLVFLGFAALAIGSEMLVRGAVAAGEAIGVPDAIIGLTVVAFGTSLPELSTCIAAASRRHTDMIVGNIVGSNTFNILSIVGLTALIKPLEVVDSLRGAELWFLVAVTVGFAAWLMTIGRIGRVMGAGLAVAYVAFVVLQYRALVIG